ncbi:GNAT family N-acetyltransferase [Sporosarcina sp. FA9]|uniref:GNAT family N-acetyltransferase n=1 Tax=Sporosarcina sp. FA9 TaxID=3413030 RepID=UPI003F65A385
MELFEYEKRFRTEVMNYKLSKEQLRFTGSPLSCVKLSKKDSNRHSILAIKNNKLVTFFVLHKNEGVIPYSRNPEALLLRSFSTDCYQQGKGFAQESLMLLPEFVRAKFPDINRIVLAVNVENTAAQSLYKKCGFFDEGIRKKSRKGELIIMCYYL